MPTDVQNAVERRKFIRINTQHVVSCCLLTIPFFKNETCHDCVSHNLSANGVLFRSKKRFNVGDVLRLAIKVPGWEKHKPEFLKPDALTIPEALIAVGNVVRVKEHAESFDIAVYLQGIDEGHQRAIKRYINIRIKNSADFV